MKILCKFIYFVHIKFIFYVKKTYYKNIFKQCGKKLRVYGSVNIKNPNNIIIGNDCTLNDGVYINGWSSVIIGNNVAISAGSMLISTSLSSDELMSGNRKHVGESIIIGDNVQIGAGAIVLSGVKIGNNVIVGAGAVVTKNIKNNTIIAGIPAKIIRDCNE